MHHILELTEEQRQLVLMSLAHLAVERPGWRDALAEIAMAIDNDGPATFNEFAAMHKNRSVRKVCASCGGEWTHSDVCTASREMIPCHDPACLACQDGRLEMCLRRVARQPDSAP